MVAVDLIQFWPLCTHGTRMGVHSFVYLNILWSFWCLFYIYMVVLPLTFEADYIPGRSNDLPLHEIFAQVLTFLG